MRAYEAVVTTVGMGLIGMMVAYIIWYLNDKGIWIDQYISVGAPIAEVMAIIIIIFLLVGVLIAGMRSR